MRQENHNMMLDEYVISLFQSEVEEVLVNCGYLPNKENVEKVIQSKVLGRLEKNIRPLLLEELEAVLLGNGQNELGFEEP